MRFSPAPAIAAGVMLAALVGCSRKEAPPPAAPLLSQQGLVLSSWKSASPDWHDRLLLAHAMAQGKTDATILVATQIGSAPSVAAAIAGFGGDVQALVDKVGYLRVRLPLERFAEISALPDVLMAHIDEAPTLAAGIERLLREAADPGVAVPTPVATGGRFPEGGKDLLALMMDRAVEVHAKPILSSAGNAGRVESINGAASGRRVLAIGTAAGSSRGPAGDGGAKPDLLADTMSAATDAVTSLMEAARAENLPADARHITWALRMGAKPLQDYQSHEQGFGVIDVTRALELLRQQQAQQLELPDILTRAPVQTSLARFLPEPHVGQGLYEREGWLVKQRDTRTITLVRQNGAATPLGYSLQWRDNDGTFATSSTQVVLPLNVPVVVPIEISPDEVGVHSAHLLLVDKSSDLPVHAVMTTVVASEQFTAANGYTIRHREAALPALRAKSYFLEVPPNVAALRLDVSVGVGQVALLLGAGGPIAAGVNIAPDTGPIDAQRPAVVLVPNPPAGVYELVLRPFDLTQHQAPGRIEVTASIGYVDTRLDPESSPDNATTLWMNNIYAPLQRSSVIAAVGVRRNLQDAAGPVGMRAYNINVASGSSSLRVSAAPVDNRARMSIHLYDCTSGSCELWGSDAFTKMLEKMLDVPNPRAGSWKAVVDAGAAGVAFNYSEIMTNPRYGAATVAGEDAARRVGARWHQQISFRIDAAPPFGYERVGVMDVTDPGSEAEQRAAPYGPSWPVRLATQVLPLQAK